MALKDWKKSKKTNEEFKEVRWDNKHDATSVSVVHDGDRWRTWLYDVFDEQGEELTKSGFKTKAQAIKKAKNYMKRH